MNNPVAYGFLALSLGLFALGGPAFADAAADVTACDALAASPFDTTRPAGVTGVKVAEIKSEAAIAACTGALQSNPDNLRVMLQTRVWNLRCPSVVTVTDLTMGM